MTARARFEELDREAHQAIIEVLTASTSFGPFGCSSPQTNWEQFNVASVRLHRVLEERHAMKHMAMREAEISGGPVVVRFERKTQ